MKVSIIYFSGTGNTKAIAIGYKEALEKNGHTVSLQSIEEYKTNEAHDLLIIGGPIYAGNMPDDLLNWVRKNIPHVSNKKAIVYSTSAGLLNANGIKSIGKKLMKRGYKVIDTLTFEMPRNFYVDKYDPTPEKIQKKQFETASQMIIESVDSLSSNSSFTIESAIKFKDSVLMIDLLADVFRIMAKSMGKNFAIEASCIGCGKCEQNCPKTNINFKEKAFSNKCMLCTRCIHNCPVNAISYKGKKIEQYKVQYSL
ncbi:EFR1 family ferrodoxin [Fusibacter bizertensis]|uniref:EFR1 family ferrodoxin n=1 Tax=Fusibacter bizertensis TaxID=1488331 RepID=A0ABT6NF85_9FIRM|nr:EFR1 family ferrodoxin [Fusibacter bizertensis]MDH8679086.1 EFR1 family ferrodoxin [Fusibacter bizertensis]